jgi:DNA invertase Pin-like site-specific DNA recombinase
VKVALYARVSTTDKEQDPETQLRHLRAIAQAYGHEIHKEYVDKASGRTVKGRDAYQQMLKDAKAHRFNAIMAYKLDRLHRNLMDAVTFVDSLRLIGIDLIVTSQAIDTSNAMGRAMMQITAVFAELESANTAERVIIGMERARAEGKLCNRPTKELTPYQIEKAKAILRDDPEISQRALASQFDGISRMTLISGLRKAGVL